MAGSGLTIPAVRDGHSGLRLAVLMAGVAVGLVAGNIEGFRLLGSVLCAAAYMWMTVAMVADIVRIVRYWAARTARAWRVGYQGRDA